MCEIIIGVPGPWQDRSAVLRAIFSLGSGYLYAGQYLMDTVTRKSYLVEILEHDPRLQEAFRVASGGGMLPDDLAAIGQHRHTLYISSSEVSANSARHMMRAAATLLECGGLGVKIESSGVAHGAARWRKLAATADPFFLYTAYVTLIHGRGYYYSCGMHNFGLPDCRVSDRLDASAAARLMNIFNHHLLAESPSLHPGHTFSLDAGTPHFRLVEETDLNHEPGHRFHNPFGLWQLQVA